MSMEHKAFLFDTKLYYAQIETIVKKCCATKDGSIAKEYIDKHYSEIFNPYTGESLDSNWENEMSSGTMQELFDFLLTSCYQPDMDIGLEYAWDGVLEAIKELHFIHNPNVCVLGAPLIYSGIKVDPGFMGLGIVEHTAVAQIKEKLLENQEKIKYITLPKDVLYELERDELIDAYDDLCNIYKRAEKEGKGILFTF